MVSSLIIRRIKRCYKWILIRFYKNATTSSGSKIINHRNQRNAHEDTSHLIQKYHETKKSKHFPKFQSSFHSSGLFCFSFLLVLACFFLSLHIFISQDGSASLSSLNTFANLEPNNLQGADIQVQSDRPHSNSNDSEVVIEALNQEILKLHKEIANLKKVAVEKSSLVSCDFVRKSIDSVKKPFIFTNEYEVNPFHFFTFTRIFSSDPGLTRKTSEKLFGRKRKEIKEVIGQSIRINQSYSVNLGDFIEGIYSSDPIIGTQYNLYFKASPQKHQQNHSSHFYHKMSFIRPFAPLLLTANEMISTAREMVHLLVPVNEDRLDTLKVFLENLKRSHLKEIQKKKLKMFVSYYGRIELFRKTVPQKLINQVIHVSNTSSGFSRAEALQVGSSVICANSNKSQSNSYDCLLFFSDVDISFNGQFLERCRLHASKGKKVYFPILFSFYNPVYSKLNQEQLSTLTNWDHVIKEDYGFWRSFGFGMVCTYATDFFAVNGFQDYIDSVRVSNPFISWGGEDVLLYRKYLQSNSINVIRAVDPGIFHIWHKKNCEKIKFQTSEQMQSCLSSKALNEGSQTQLAHAMARMISSKN